MRRLIQPEILDELARRRPARHPVAARSAEGQHVHGSSGHGDARAARARRRPRACWSSSAPVTARFLLQSRQAPRAPAARARRARRSPPVAERRNAGRIRGGGLGRRHRANRMCSSGCAVLTPKRPTSRSRTCSCITSSEGELATPVDARGPADEAVHRLRAAAIAHRPRGRVAAAPDRLQRRHDARRRHQRARGLPRSRAVEALAVGRRMAAD